MLGVDRPRSGQNILRALVRNCYGRAPRRELSALQIFDAARHREVIKIPRVGVVAFMIQQIRGNFCGGEISGQGQQWLLLVDLFTAGPLGPNPRLFAGGVAVFLAGWGVTRLTR